MLTTNITVAIDYHCMEKNKDTINAPSIKVNTDIFQRV